ncbi:MAG: FHA domain-containing protein [Cyanobacteria bacterium P01_A01_bin.68]
MPANRCPNPTCEYFNRALPNNAKVCPWCSTPLGNVVPSAASNPPSVQTPPPERPAPQPVVDYYATDYQQPPYVTPTPQPQPPAQRFPILKLIHPSGREFSLCGETGSIGRRTQSMPTPPEIDLSGIPQEGIVSRRHARVFWDWSQNTYMIVDTSKNGIYLNGNLLNSGVSYRILNGDSLQLGQDNLVVFKVAIA